MYFITSCLFLLVPWKGYDLSRLMTKPTKWRAPSEDSDQPGHPSSLIRIFAVRRKNHWVLSYPLSAQRRVWSDWADAQTDPSLRWAHSHIVGFLMRRLIYACGSFCAPPLLCLLVIPCPWFHLPIFKDNCYEPMQSISTSYTRHQTGKEWHKGWHKYENVTALSLFPQVLAILYTWRFWIVNHHGFYAVSDSL